jgi:hypothetical protein
MIKLKDLLEQAKVVKLQEQTEELNLGPIQLAAIYGNNRVQVANNNWQRNAQQLVDQINNAVANDFILNNLQITVTGIASTLNATTRFSTTGPGNSTNPPDHNYQAVGTPTGGNLPQPWSATGSFVNVPNGNQFLATTRAQLMGRLLDQFLRSNLDQQAVAQLPQNYIVTRGVVQGRQPSMTAQITSKLTKRPIPDLPPFQIKYQWFNLQGVSKSPLVLINTSDSFYKGANPTPNESIPSSFLRTIKNSAIPFAGFQSTSEDPKKFEVRGTAFIQINPDSSNKDTAFYNSYDKWLEDVQKMLKVTPSKGGIGIKIQGSNDMLLRGGVRGSVQSDRKGGVANFIKNDRTFVSGREYYLLKPATESPKLMANLYQEKPLAQQQIPSHLQQLSYMGVTKVS